MSMATKLGKVMTCYEGLPLTKSHNLLIVWSWRITLTTKPIISLLPQWLWPLNLAGLFS